MNKKALRVLEYDKIKELLAEMTGSSASREMARSLSPLGDIRDIIEETRSTTEAVDLIVRKGPLPTEGSHELKGITKLASKGGSLTMKQLLDVAYDLRLSRRIQSFLSGEVPEIPKISELAGFLEPHDELESDISRCILSEDEMADSASQELKRLRVKIKKANEDIRSKLSRIVASEANSKFLRDTIVTVRDGRYVVPVKPEYKAMIPGIVHDQSKGGRTLFIEPNAIVELNNKLKELMLAEEAEIERILADLSGRVGVLAGDIVRNEDHIARLDFIMAKGKLSCAMKGEEPKLTEESGLVIKEGRHPLLDPEKVVPITVELGTNEEGEGYRTLVVTGPNTGGKTVTLKTVGLITLMALSGLHIPASGESVIPIYKNVFADIGDEQSLEQSLSTFSAHMKNIVYIVGVADRNSLVLLDELGAGTDPTEGAALGVAVLERLFDKGANTIATTHYNELKKYALSTNGIENASMEFDVDTLSPTFRLITGVAGKSNAFEISKKLGLSGRTIQRAQELIDKGDLEFEDVVTAMDEDRQKGEEARAEAEKLLSEMQTRKAAFDKEQTELESKKDEILRSARKEAREILTEAKETYDDVRKELNSLNGEKNLGKRNMRLAEARQEISDKEKKFSEKITIKNPHEPVDKNKLEKGDKVMYLPFSQNGEIVSLPDKKGKLTVQIGSAVVTCGIKDIEFISHAVRKDASEISSGPRVSDMMIKKAMNTKREVDVRGKCLDDALMDIEKYIDDLTLAHADQAVIIHGRGEGILKAGIRRELKRNKHVASQRPGEYDEGGDGVTVITLK